MMNLTECSAAPTQRRFWVGACPMDVSDSARHAAGTASLNGWRHAREKPQAHTGPVLLSKNPSLKSLWAQAQRARASTGSVSE
jgi:hypothetical protein